MIKKSIALILAFGAYLALPAAHAATVTICENLARPAGYLAIQTGLPNGSCTTKKATKYSTPSNGLIIIRPQELQGFTPPYAVISKDSAAATYTIALIKDGLVACASPVILPYDYFKKSNGVVGACGTTNPGTDNSIKYFKVMNTEIALPSGRPGEIRVSLNNNYTGPGFNYAITTTSTLNGGIQTVLKSGISASGSFTLKQLAPDLVDEAEQGAAFTFTIEAFFGISSASKNTLVATGQEMTMN